MKIKRAVALLLTLLLVAALCVCAYGFDVSAAERDINEVVRMALNSNQVQNGIEKLIDVIRDGGDGGKIFQCVLEIYPDFVAAIKRAEVGLPTPGGGGSGVCQAVVRSQVIRDDFVRLTEYIRGGDAGKIFQCVLEIYPDFVTTIKRAM